MPFLLKREKNQRQNVIVFLWKCSAAFAKKNIAQVVSFPSKKFNALLGYDFCEYALFFLFLFVDIYFMACQA